VAYREQSELVTVYRNVDPMLVQIAQDLLCGAGIEAYVFDAETSRMLGMMRGRAAAVPPRVVVYEDRAEEARGRLQEHGFI
jgi:hypothetical protein